MAHIYLTSKGFFNESVKSGVHEWVRGNAEGLKAAIITTASSKKAADPLAVKTRADFFGMGIPQVDFLDIEFEQPSALLHYHIFYICGGNPYHLFQQLKRTGADRVFQRMLAQEAMFIGVSAGAMIFGPHIEIANHFTPAMNTSGLTDFTALGIHEKPLFPHYGREEKFKDSAGKTIEERIAAFEAETGAEVERLSDSEALKITR